MCVHLKYTERKREQMYQMLSSNESRVRRVCALDFLINFHFFKFFFSKMKNEVKGRGSMKPLYWKQETGFVD